MGAAFLHGNGGGTELPFRIFGGTVEPGSPKDGDIWIKTDNAITGVDFSDPWSGATIGRTVITGSPVGGLPSASNTRVTVVAGKTNGIQVFGKLDLIGCKQVQGSTGNWVNLDAYRYYGGTWVQFSVHRYYLYNYLDGKTAYDGITGGWNHYETVDGCVSIVHTSLNQEAFTRCASKIDFSGYTTLYIESYRYDNTSSESGITYAIGTQTDTTIFSWGAIKGGFGGSRKAWSTWSIDVSSLTESAYFAFWGYYEKAAIRAMWLE